jgi:hypothetical protein
MEMKMSEKIIDAEWEELEIFDQPILKSQNPKKKESLWFDFLLLVDTIIFSLIFSRVLGFFLYGI